MATLKRAQSLPPAQQEPELQDPPLAHLHKAAQGPAADQSLGPTP